MSRIRIASGLALAVGLTAASFWALWPDPLAVDLAPVTRGPMQGVLSAEGVTRVRDPYTVTAPIAGATTRSPVEVGDEVRRGETVVAVIRPADPGLMDTRSRAQAEATVAEARAAVHLSEANIARARSALDHAGQQAVRGRSLAESGTLSQRMLDDLEHAERSAAQALAAAEAERELAGATLRRAEAQLLGPGSRLVPDGDAGECCVEILAPRSGIVLDVPDRNARQVSAGTLLLTVGDIEDLEIEIDLLSSDAVRVPPAAPARVERWGGDAPLEARVRRVDPAAFTRVSALGIEEQRVNVQLDLLSPPAERPGLGDRFRVLVRIVIWQEDGLLQIPQSALFRQGDGWAVFRELDGLAELTPVTPGRQTDARTEITSGLEEGDQVVLYPASALSDGARIVPREE